MWFGHGTQQQCCSEFQKPDTLNHEMEDNVANKNSIQVLVRKILILKQSDRKIEKDQAGK